MLRHLDLITPPTEPLISSAEAKAHLRVTHDREDTLIELYTAAAEAALDGARGALGRALKPQTWQLTLSEFPCGSIRLPLPPFRSLESFEYDDEAGETYTVAADAYRTRTHAGVTYLEPKLYWPAPSYAVRIQFAAGFDADKVPADIRAAALLILTGLYENRSDTIDPRAAAANEAVANLTARYTAPSW